MKHTVLFFILLLLAANVVMAFEPTTAEENNPETNDDANACFIGGVWEGKCNSVDVNQDGRVEQWETDYIYSAGWYLIRFDYGLISREEFPSQYLWALPVEAVTEEVIEVVIAPPTNICFDSTLSGYVDTQYTGTPNNPSNLLRFSSTNGTCTTSLGSASTAYIVIANNLAAADALCPLPFVGQAATYGYTTMPSKFYICITAAP